MNIGPPNIQDSPRRFLAEPYAQGFVIMLINRKSSFSDTAYALSLADNVDGRFFQMLDSLRHYFMFTRYSGHNLSSSLNLMLNRRVSDALCLPFAAGSKTIKSIFKYDETLSVADVEIKSAIYQYINGNISTNPLKSETDRFDVTRFEIKSAKIYREMLRTAHAILPWDDVIRLSMVVDAALYFSSQGSNFILHAALEPFFDDEPGDDIARRANAYLIRDIASDAFRDVSIEEDASICIEYSVEKSPQRIITNMFMSPSFGDSQSTLFSFGLSAGIIDDIVNILGADGDYISLTLHSDYYNSILDLIDSKFSDAFADAQLPEHQRRAFVESLASSILEVSAAYFDTGEKIAGRKTSPSVQAIPSVAPLEWQKHRRNGETPPEFVMRAYADAHGNGLTMADVRRLDKPLAQALYYHFRKQEPIPPDFDLPTKQEKTSREISAYAETGQLAISDPTDTKHVLREYERLRQAQWRRRQKGSTPEL